MVGIPEGVERRMARLGRVVVRALINIGDVGERQSLDWWATLAVQIN